MISIRSFRSRLMVLIASAAITGMGANASRAGIVIDLPDLVVESDNVTPLIGTFEVLLQLNDVGNTDLTNPPNVSGYNLGIAVTSGGAGLMFTNVATTTTATPLFPGPLNGTSTPEGIEPATQLAIANDDIITGSPFQIPAVNGAGLVRITFNIAPGSVGTTYQMAFEPEFLTQLSRFDGLDSTILTLTLSGGSITVTAVPEVGSWAMLLAATSIGGGLVVIRRRRVNGAV